MGDRLRPLWDFDDLDATEQRMKQQLDREASDVGRAEVLTQLARAEGLRERFPEGERLLAEAAAVADPSPVLRARVAIEKGRLLRSAGDAAASLPLFESAYGIALPAGEEFLAVDAAHMAALASPDRRGKLDWTERGVEIAQQSKDREVTYWLGPLENNLGWEYFDAGDFEAALDCFQRALESRLQHPEMPAGIEHAKEAIAEALRALGREA